MMFDLPNPDTLYDALLARDPSYEGRAFVGVRSTGIFCRLTCPARKPLRKNCTFFETIAAASEAGYRPCKRCKPLDANGALDPMVSSLLKALDDNPGYRWREADLVALGLELSTVRRSFKRLFGKSFLELARQRRLAEGFTVLADNRKVIDAQLEAGFESPSAFRAAFAKLLGIAPGHLRAKARLQAAWIETEIGPMVTICDNNAVYLLEFADRKALATELKTLSRDAKGDIGIGRTDVTDQVEAALQDYFSGATGCFDLPIAPGGTDFQRRVWSALQDIPAGQTRSYAELARDIGQPTATRAVARANGANRLAIIIPCHRVIGADGSLTGYGGGIWRKEKLIAIERQYK